MFVRFLSRVVEEFSFAQAFWNMLTMCGVDPLSLAVLVFSGPRDSSPSFSSGTCACTDSLINFSF